MKTLVSTPNAVPPLPVFSQAVISGGHVYVSGNIGCTKDFKIVEGGVKAQTRAALNNLAIVLKAAGSGLDHIVKANIYLSNMERDFKPMNEVYIEFFTPAMMPARTCVGVAKLPMGADMEIECVAEIPGPAVSKL
ncbi:Endoribonuclease L-PSP [Athelia psychrophila]|uniref:Endoribonuclease L-PSP n=1 Tax=Athelia psychrophila TaxID=1759441 RepID=A0A166J5S5_9AGAM|nr:Endoribonuclease L-PSP [Fibularhizoctonia sp. CBS 109695]